MKYIIETEMPLTEVYVEVSREEFSRVRLDTSVSKKGWLETNIGWLRPLPVSPMKEVGEEEKASMVRWIRMNYDIDFAEGSHWHDCLDEEETPISDKELVQLWLKEQKEVQP